ncbi:MAG: tetratricopeptide repeat protein, partial [Candidatus Binatia bacterium]
MRTVLDLATVLLFFPLLGGTSQPQGLSQLLDGYRERSGSETAVAILRGLSELSDDERPIARFLLAHSLAELGLPSLATRELVGLLDHPDLGGAAFLGLARLQSGRSEAAALLRHARSAAWDRMGDDEFSEAVFRVARASFFAGRYPEARSWLVRVPEGSAYFPFSRYLLAQTEYALERYGEAIEAADAVFRAHSPRGPRRWLQDRTAILVGDMLTEIGLYPDAVAVLAWLRPDSPFHARAELDQNAAQSLAEIEAGASDRAIAAEERVEAMLAEQDRAIAATTDALSARAADLRQNWPSDDLRRSRRRAAWATAAEAHERSRSFDWRRPIEVLWQSLPPVMLSRIFMRAPTPAVRAESA